MEDVFEPVYTPRKIEFWLDHWEELDAIAHTPKSAAHIAEHLAREWFMLQGRMKACLCKELHDVDVMAVDPACSHEPSGGGAYRSTASSALCIVADLRSAADLLPPEWLATRTIWHQQGLGIPEIGRKVRAWRNNHVGFEREPVFARSIAVRRMARQLGWSLSSNIEKDRAA